MGSRISSDTNFGIARKVMKRGAVKSGRSSRTFGRNVHSPSSWYKGKSCKLSARFSMFLQNVGKLLRLHGVTQRKLILFLVTAVRM